MKFSSAFESILRQRNMDLPALAERAKLSVDRLQAASSEKFDLSDEELHSIAKALAVPEGALFGRKPIELSNIPDFRRNRPAGTLLEPEIISAIGYLEKVSFALDDLGVDLQLSDKVVMYDGPLTKNDAKKLAATWREKWGMTDQRQLEEKSASEMYKSLRSFVEGLGVFVMHYSFKTDSVAGLYAKVNGGPHTILINSSSSSKARKLFTLAHEFCHVLLGKDGISNPSIVKNNVEVFCNQFAAYLVAPDSVLKEAIRYYKYQISFGNSSIRLLAKNLGISQQACAVRLIDLGLVTADQYGRWMKTFKGVIPDGDLSDAGGGGAEPDPIKNKITHYGNAFIKSIYSAVKNGDLDQIEIYRNFGIKPKYQKAIFGRI